jgi:hypothetical protein
MNEHWKPPDELTRARPRAVVLAPAGVALIVVSFLLVAGGIGVGIALDRLAGMQSSEQQLLAEQGEEADGVVTRQWRARSKDQQRWVAYQFSAGGGLFEGRSKAPRRQWDHLTVGTHLPVRYVRSNPSLNHPSGWPANTLPVWVPFLIAGLMVVSGGVVWLPIRSQYRLLSDGRPAPATITRYQHIQHGKVFYYEFPVLSGSVAKGRSGPSHRPPEIGSTICVLYSPDDSARSAPYPFSLVKIEGFEARSRFLPRPRIGQVRR